MLREPESATETEPLEPRAEVDEAVLRLPRLMIQQAILQVEAAAPTRAWSAAAVDQPSDRARSAQARRAWSDDALV